jgi:hypothetical protein
MTGKLADTIFPGIVEHFKDILNPHNEEGVQHIHLKPTK